MIPTVLQNCVIQMQDAESTLFNGFLELYLGPRSTTGDDVKDSRGKNGEPVLEREFTVSSDLCHCQCASELTIVSLCST